MSELDTRPNRFPWPPVLYLAAIGASLAARFAIACVLYSRHC